MVWPASGFVVEQHVPGRSRINGRRADNLGVRLDRQLRVPRRHTSNEDNTLGVCYVKGSPDPPVPC